MVCLEGHVLRRSTEGGLPALERIALYADSPSNMMLLWVKRA
jgi:hypothetical protein